MRRQEDNDTGSENEDTVGAMCEVAHTETCTQTARSAMVMEPMALHRTVCVGAPPQAYIRRGSPCVAYHQNPKTTAQRCCTQPITNGKQNCDHPKCIARSSASIAVPPSLCTTWSSAILHCRWSVRELLAWQQTECATPPASQNLGTNRK